MTFALALLLLTGSPDAVDTPRDALDRLAAAVRAGELLAAYDQLGENGRAVLDKELGRAARALGLDPATAKPRDVVEALQGRFRTEQGKAMLKDFALNVLKSDETEDRASAQVEVIVGGRKDRVVLLLARTDGRWTVDGIDTSEAKRRANEVAAIATLRNIVSAQAQFQAAGLADADQDGCGEYGTFGELSGAVGIRGGKTLGDPVLPTGFRAVEKGVVTRSGYHFRIYLCDADGKPVGEEQGTAGVDADKAEAIWCAYAWPVEHGKTGTRTFFVNQFGDVLAVEGAAYGGAKAPAADAAFKPDETRGRITGDAAIGTPGNDNNTWKPLR